MFWRAGVCGVGLRVEGVGCMVRGAGFNKKAGA